MLRRICLRSFCHHYYGRLFSDHSLMSYQKVWNNDSGDLSTLLPFSIIWVNCNPPFCLWISIFFSNSSFFFFKSVLYPLQSPPKVCRENCVHSLHTMPNFSFIQQWNSSMQQAIHKSKRETGREIKQNQTLTPTVRDPVRGGPGSICLSGVLTLFWPTGGPNMMLISSSALLYILFSLPPNTRAVTEMRENIWGIIQSYVWCVRAFSELILGDIPV